MTELQASQQPIVADGSCAIVGARVAGPHIKEIRAAEARIPIRAGRNVIDVFLIGRHQRGEGAELRLAPVVLQDPGQALGHDGVAGSATEVPEHFAAIGVLQKIQVREVAHDIRIQAAAFLLQREVEVGDGKGLADLVRLNQRDVV